MNGNEPEQPDLEPLAQALDAAGKSGLARTTRAAGAVLARSAARRALEPDNAAIEPGRELVFRPLGVPGLVRATVGRILFDQEGQAGDAWERRRLAIFTTAAGAHVLLDRRTGVLIGRPADTWHVAQDLAGLVKSLDPADPLDLAALGALGALDGLPEV